MCCFAISYVILQSLHSLQLRALCFPAVLYKHVDYAITFEGSHNIDDPYRNIHPTPPHPMPSPPPHGVGWRGVDIAIGVINVMTYFECYGIVNMLVQDCTKTKDAQLQRMQGL
jgi:hypothetical protein